MASQYDFLNLMKAGGYNPMGDAITTNQMQDFRLQGLLNNMNQTDKKINALNLPPLQQPNPQAELLKKQKKANMFLAFGDLLKGKDATSGFSQRQAMFDAKQKEAERKANIEKYKKSNPGMVGMLEALESGIPPALLMMQQNKNLDKNKLSFTNEDKLRDEHQKLSGTFIDVRDAYGRILTSAEKQTAASDLSLIFNYMKMLDPGSVVREGEFANAQNSAGVPDRTRAQYNNLIRGERLAPATRSDFINQAQGLYKTQLGSQNSLDTQYSDLATSYELDPNKVVLDFGSPIAKKEFKYNLSVISDEELGSLDESQYTEEQIEAIEKELRKRLK